MIVFERLGGWGFGNSLFQIAASIGIAEKRYSGWAVPHDCAFIKKYGHVFQNPLPVVKDNGRMKEWPHWGIGEPFNYLPFPPEHKDCIIDGFFQNSQFFKNAEQKVRAIFELADCVKGKAQHDLAIPGLTVPIIGIHVRRGDYVSNPDMALLDLDYYIQAMFSIDGLNDHRVIIFSDDIPYCKQRFLLRPGTPYEFFEADDISTFAAMKVCDVLITANSTFSWWAGYLGGHKVIMPKGERWFTEEYKGKHNTLYSGINMPGATII